VTVGTSEGDLNAVFRERFPTAADFVDYDL
jgi:hypothetical protein